jgi:hypothetical protein
MARIKVVLGERQRIVKEAKTEVRHLYSLKKKREKLEQTLLEINERQKEQESSAKE